MASRWMRPKLDKLRRDGMATPPRCPMLGVTPKADLRAMVQSLDHEKITRCAPAVKRRDYLDRNDPRVDRRTYGDFNRKRNTNFQRGLLGDAMVLGGPARLIRAE